MTEDVDDGVDWERFWPSLIQLWRKVAEAQLRLRPNSPASHKALGDVVRADAEGSADQQVALRHYQRALELARAQGSDCWTARLAYYLGSWAIDSQAACLPPAEAARLLDEANAAHARLKGVPLPGGWLNAQRQRRAAARALRPELDAHLRLGGGLWDPRVEPSVQARVKIVEAQEKASVFPVCDGCGSGSLATMLCSACRQARYCSQACQRSHWKSHKADCKAVQAAAAATKSDTGQPGAGAASGASHARG